MYLIKKIVIFIMTFSVYLSSNDSIKDFVPESKKAISIYADKKEETLEINFKLHEGVYVYRNKIRAKQEKLSKPFIILGEITLFEDNFFGPQPILQKDFILSLNLSDIIPEGYLYLEYQGCFENSFCYSKEEKKISY